MAHILSEARRKMGFLCKNNNNNKFWLNMHTNLILIISVQYLQSDLISTSVLHWFTKIKTINNAEINILIS